MFYIREYLIRSFLYFLCIIHNFMIYVEMEIRGHMENTDTEEEKLYCKRKDVNRLKHFYIFY